MAQDQAQGASLDPDEILTAEFQYIAQTAFQANEDRARVTNFYLVTLGGFIAALVGSQLPNLPVPQVYWAFAAGSAILFLASVLALLQLVRLREAWFDSVAAMNRIKGYYQERLPGFELGRAFAWSAGTLPAKYKPWSVGFLLALQVAVLGGACAGAAVVFLGLAGGVWAWGPALALGVLSAAGQMAAYWFVLRSKMGGEKQAVKRAGRGTAARA